MAGGALRLVERLTEVTLIGMLAWSVWPFGSVHPYFELIVAYPLAIILVLWSLRMLLAGRPLGFDLPAAGQLMANGLLGLFLAAAFQLLPLPPSLLQTLSPNVTPLVEELIPQPREMLATAESPIATLGAGTVGRSLSLNPGGSYQFAIRLLVLSSLFLAVSSLRGPLETLRRLAVAMTIVGACLALFALVQRLTGGADTIYGYYTFPLSGDHERTFGPFINRNHYPFYANLCLGLAVGLLLERRERIGHRWYDLVQDTLSLWLLVGIGLIAASLFVCVSRGGVVSMLIGALACLTVRLQRGRKIQAVTAVVGLGGAAAVLLVWIGFDVLESRLGWLLEAERYRSDGRWKMWQAAIPVIVQFPLFGAGGDTFQYWETIYSALAPGWSGGLSLRADNEFLDISVEFGIVGLVSLLILTVGGLYQGFQLGRERPLAAGALMGLLAVVVHSCFDFGLRIPASALLATTVAGLLAALRPPPLPAEASVALGSHAAARSHNSGGARHRRESVGESHLASRLAGALLAVAVVGVASSLVMEKRRYSAAESWRLDAFQALSDKDFPRILDSLQKAEAATPEDVQLHVEAAYCLLAGADRAADDEDRGTFIDRALEHCVKARDLCPLAWEPPLWLAEHASRLAIGSSQLDYLLTAQRLSPTNSEINFTAGALLFEAGRWDEAWPFWHDHLVITRRQLPRIMELAGEHLTSDQMIERLLPAELGLMSAAAGIAQRAGQEADRQKYLAAVVQLAEEKLAPGSPDRREALRDPDLAVQLGRAYRELGRPTEAIESFQRAVRYRPTQVDWRVEMARQLIDAGQLDEARRHVRTALDMQPEHRAGQLLRLEIARQQAEQQARAAGGK